MRFYQVCEGYKKSGVDRKKNQPIKKKIINISNNTIKSKRVD